MNSIRWLSASWSIWEGLWFNCFRRQVYNYPTAQNNRKARWPIHFTVKMISVTIYDCFMLNFWILTVIFFSSGIWKLLRNKQHLLIEFQKWKCFFLYKLTDLFLLSWYKMEKCRLNFPNSCFRLFDYQLVMKHIHDGWKIFILECRTSRFGFLSVRNCA